MAKNVVRDIGRMTYSLFLFMRRLKTFVILYKRIVTHCGCRIAESCRELCQLFLDLYYHCLYVPQNKSV